MSAKSTTTRKRTTKSNPVNVPDQVEPKTSSTSSVSQPDSVPEKHVPVKDLPVKLEPRVELPPSDPTEPQDKSPPAKRRKTVSVERITDTFQHIHSELESELNGRISDGKSVKFLRTLNKRVKLLELDTMRALKKVKGQKRKLSPSTRSASGFCKECSISPELARFMGVDVSEKKSRVDATRSIIAYIKKHDLQDPKEKKYILPDSTLATLLGFTGKETHVDKQGNTVPTRLTFFLIQNLIQKHFVKNVPGQVEPKSV